MKVHSNEELRKEEVGGFSEHPPKPIHCDPVPPHCHAPIPPHERNRLLQIEFEEEDISILHEVFGNDYTVRAAMEIISRAPQEIQVLVLQLIKAIKKGV